MVAAGSGNRNLFKIFQSTVARVTCNVKDMNGSLYWDSHQSCMCLQIWASICTVMVDTVVTGEVNY